MNSQVRFYMRGKLGTKAFSTSEKLNYFGTCSIVQLHEYKPRNSLAAVALVLAKMSTICLSDKTMDILTNLFTLNENSLNLFHERKEKLVVELELLEEEVEYFYKAIDLAHEYRNSPEGQKAATEAIAIQFMEKFPSIVGFDTDEEVEAMKAMLDKKIDALITLEKGKGMKILHERLQ
jgi:hypothetical protein